MSDIIAVMLQQKDEIQARHLSRFFKTGEGQYGHGDRFLGIKVPVTRQIVKHYWQYVTIDEMEEMIKNEYHEIRLCALLILIQMFKRDKKKPEKQREYIDFYLSHTQYINNWDLVDLSCYELLGTWLLDKDRSILYKLAINGKTIWEQRISIVSCMTLVRHGMFDDAYQIADILLHHPHDLIHKAVGWILRECGKRDEARLRSFLNTSINDKSLPRYKTMPRTMLRYAIEKMEEPVRQSFLHG